MNKVEEVRKEHFAQLSKAIAELEDKFGQELKEALEEEREKHAKTTEDLNAVRGEPMEKVITNLYKHGNTSAASIPLRVKKGDGIACAGFGAGLSWGAAILKWG